MLSDAELLCFGAEYIKWDPNEETKAQVASYVGTNNTTELRKILSTRLEFGTAGLRGPMGAGYNRMNDLVVMQTAQGISRYLVKQLGQEAKTKVCLMQRLLPRDLREE